MKDYEAKVVEVYGAELTAKERIMFKDFSNMIPLNEECDESAFIIKPVCCAKVEVHNEKSENKDYSVYVVKDENGALYYTSSETFYRSYTDLLEELETDGITDFEIKVYKKESKNYKGKGFITCSLI